MPFFLYVCPCCTQNATNTGQSIDHTSRATFFKILPYLRAFQVQSLRRNMSRKTIYIAYTGWRTKCRTIDYASNTFLLLQKHLTPGTELILIGWKIVPNEEHVQCDHRFASQHLANEPLHSSQFFDTSLQKARGTNSLRGP